MGAPLLGGGDDRAREERRRTKEEAEGRALDALGALLRPHVTQGSRERAKDVAHTALAGAGFGAVIGAAWGGFREVRGIRHELQVNERVRAAAAVAAARSGHTAGHVKQQPLSEGLFTGYKMQSLSFMLSRAVRGAAVYGGASLAYAGLFDALRFGGGLDALGVDTSAARGESGDSKPHALAVGATAAVIGACGASPDSLARRPTKNSAPHDELTHVDAVRASPCPFANALPV